MGRRCLLDAVASRNDSEDFAVFSEQDVIASFDKMIQLRFMQTETLKGVVVIQRSRKNGILTQNHIGRASGIQVTAYPAGHTVGGTIWKIKEDTNDIVYAVDYNHLKERLVHLVETVS